MIYCNTANTQIDLFYIPIQYSNLKEENSKPNQYHTKFSEIMLLQVNQMVLQEKHILYM